MVGGKRIIYEKYILRDVTISGRAPVVEGTEVVVHSILANLADEARIPHNV